MSSALVDPIRSIEIKSQNTNYENYESGAWKITKSAKWVGRGKARITLSVDSVSKDDDRPKDVLLVLDNSGSMLGKRLNTAKFEISQLVNTLMTERNARFGLVTFNSTASLVQDLTDNRQSILNAIDGLGVYGQTNYYQAIQKMDEVFADYNFSAGRRPIVVFLTDGVPTVDTPLEVAEFQAFKSKYPEVSVRAVQYEMGEDIVEPLKTISDKQWSTEVEIFGETLWRAIAEDAFDYDEFVVTDFINNEYYEISSVNSINASVGTYALSYEGGVPKVTWDMSGLYLSGTKERLTIDVRIKDQYFADEDGRYPTNTRTEVKTSIRNAPSENLFSNNTPILKLKYLVTMNNNVPDPSCPTVVSSEKHIVFDPVSMDYDTGEWCGGYYTHGWDVVNEEIQRIGTDYFLMPEEDVDLRALWRKVSISKSMEGTTYPVATALLKPGFEMNKTMKNLVPGANATVQWAEDDTITAFRRAETLPENYGVNNSAKLSADNSPFPVYTWLGTDGKTVFYWTDAEKIYLDPDSNCIFEAFKAIENVAGLADFDASKTTLLGYMFKNTKIADISPLADWDVSNVTTLQEFLYNDTAIENVDSLINWSLPNLTIIDCFLYGATNVQSIRGLKNFGAANLVQANLFLFDAKKLTSLDGLEDWDVRKLKELSNAIRGAEMLNDISALTEWETDSLERIDGMFRDAHVLEDISALSNWDVSHVYDFGYAFCDAWALSSLAPLSDWDVSSGRLLFWMFTNDSAIADLTPLAGWRLNSATNISKMFSGNGTVTSTAGLADWGVDGVTDMTALFEGADSLTDISALASWKNHLGSLEDLTNFFDGAHSLANISALSEWNAPKLKSLNGTFAHTYALRDVSALEDWDVSHVEILSRTFMESSVDDLSPLADWEVGNVTTMSELFYKASNITELEPLRGWDVTNVKDLGHVFRELPNITSLEPIKDWNVVNVENLFATFFYDSGITDLSPLANWGAKMGNNLKNTAWAFTYLYGVTDISALSSWDVSNVTTMHGMFNAVSMADLSAIEEWDVGHVIDFNSMFYSCRALADVSAIFDWAVQDQVDMEEMFWGIPATTLPDWYEE